jgi:protein-S-isoprenylcysteine O-methyltransferase Ste14
VSAWKPRVVPPIYFLASILLMIGLHRWLPMGRLISGPPRLLGAIPLALGLVLNLGGAMRFQKGGTPLVPGSESNMVHREGLYRYTRNPMYLGFVLELLGVALFLGSLSPLAVPPLFAVLIQTLFVRHEERWMEQQFGEEYLTYKRTTRRWM